MSEASSPRSTTSATFERFEKRISLENLLREANLDRDTLLQILKQNPVAIADLDESKIQSIIQQAKIKQIQDTKSNNPFASHQDNDDTLQVENEQKDEKNHINSHYNIIKTEFYNLRQTMSKLQNKMKLESYSNDVKQKKEYNARLLALKQLSQQKKDTMLQCNKMSDKYELEKELISIQIDDIETHIKNEKMEQENLLLKKIALQQNVIKNDSKLQHLLAEKQRFSSMRDLSQFKPIAVFYVLKYFEIGDFISSILCCKAWYFSLNKACYFRMLTRNIMIQKSRHKNKAKLSKFELVSSETKLKRINHAVMQLKMAANKKKVVKTPRPDDIYSQCMQQLQKVIAQSEQDREELEDRVKAQMGILKFMQTSMYNKMNELSALRVRKWLLKNKSCNEYQIVKKKLNDRIKGLEVHLNGNRLLIGNIKQNMMEQENIRIKKLKIQSQLKSVTIGTQDIQQTNELKKLKQQTKKLAQLIVKLRQEIPKRNQEVKKYKNRVDLLQSQYRQYSQQPLP